MQVTTGQLESESEETRRIDVADPRSGLPTSSFVATSAADLDALSLRLREGQRRWAEIGLDARRLAMQDWADAIEANAQAIGDAEMNDTSRRRVAHEVPHIVAGAIRHWCRVAPDVVRAAERDGTSSVDPTITFRTQLVPLGLVGMITPWNHPFLLSTLDAVPALLSGCAVIVKPSEIAPRFIDPVMETVNQVPSLAAVFQYVKGDGVTGQELIERVDAVCFTGSVPTGRKVAEACARRFIPAFLELGGKDAAIVTESADIDRATDAVLRGAVHNTGQICFATERVYVHESIYLDFVELLTHKAEALELNYPDIGHGHIQPFIFRRQADIADAHLEEAVEKGAVIRSGGPSVSLDGGRYMRATVVTGVDHDMTLMQEETFAPIVPVMPYADEDEAVALANDSQFGLSGAVIAGSADEAERIARRINAGAISLQDTSLTPFIMGDAEKTSFGYSGLGGSRMGPNALTRFCRKKALIRRNGPATPMSDMAEDGYAPR